MAIDGDRLVAWTRDIEELKSGPYVLAIGRFRSPRLEDLNSLALDDEDLMAIRRCRRGVCGVELAGPEIDRLRQTIAGAGENWKPVVQDAFRRIVLQRVAGHLANGHPALHGYEDKAGNDGPLSPGARFSGVLNRSTFLTGRAPRFAEYLHQYPRAPIAEVESFVYYLAYMNRSDADVVSGLWGGLARVVMERRLKKEAATVLLGLRQRLESGDPE